MESVTPSRRTGERIRLRKVSRSRHPRAFTLIELLVVIAITRAATINRRPVKKQFPISNIQL
jgi:Prokaryotic N-terminal methylation motif